MKENRLVTWIRKHPVWSIAFALLLFVVGIPVLINLCYSCDHVFYVTRWDAADVLAFYGTILGASIAAASLIVTIRFTRRQIERESYIKGETEKWNKAEMVVDKALLAISPLNMVIAPCFAEKLNEMIDKNITALQRYKLSAKTSLDGLKIYISPDDYPVLSSLVEQMLKGVEEYCKIADDTLQPFNSMVTHILNQSENLDKHIVQLNEESTQSAGQIAIAYSGSYQDLLNLKRATFESIYSRIEKEANQKLSLFRSADECPHLNGSEKTK